MTRRPRKDVASGAARAYAAASRRALRLNSHEIAAVGKFQRPALTADSTAVYSAAQPLERRRTERRNAAYNWTRRSANRKASLIRSTTDTHRCNS